MFAKLAETVMKHSKAIIAVWIVIFVCCVPFMLKADSVLEYELTKMTGSDSESAQGNAYMDQYFTLSSTLIMENSDRFWEETRFSEGSVSFSVIVSGRFPRSS